jgi:23S rRNA pseudouridine955/2504/2580 synthase
VRTFTVGEDDDGIRLDRWFKRNLPDISFNTVSRWARTRPAQGRWQAGDARRPAGNRAKPSNPAC